MSKVVKGAIASNAIDSSKVENGTIIEEDLNSTFVESLAKDSETMLLTGDQTAAGVKGFSDGIVLPKTSGKGIKVDPSSPTYAWADLIGTVLPRETGANAPSLSTFRGGNVKLYAFGVGDKFDCEFHVPHDYAPGTDLYIHVHWSHNGTNISGTFAANFYHTYAKRDSQSFPAEKTLGLSVSSLSIGNTPQYVHRVDEVQISTNGGSSTQLDTAAIEPDGVILVSFDVTTIPTITGGSQNEPFVFYVDLHYQTTGLIGTKSKISNFYA
jgi:flagellar hook protein FlgE